MSLGGPPVRGGAPFFGRAASPAVGIFSLGAILAAAWMMKDSYVGSRDRIRMRQEELRVQNNYDFWSKGNANWSGNPGTDGLTQKWFGFKQKGPWGLREKWQSFKIWAGGMFNDVLLPNLIPLGVGIAGLYGAGIKVHRPFTAAAQHIGGLFGPGFFRQLGNFMSSAFGTLGNGLFRLLKLPFTSLTAFGISLGALTLGSFFLKRFNDSDNGDGQRNFFRDEIYTRR